MADESAKGVFIEKLIFAILPLLVAGVGYLLSAVNSLKQEVTILNSKTSLVVTSDNKQAVNTGAELAREKLRQDLAQEIQNNRDMILENRTRIAVQDEKIKNLQQKVK